MGRTLSLNFYYLLKDDKKDGLYSSLNFYYLLKDNKKDGSYSEPQFLLSHMR